MDFSLAQWGIVLMIAIDNGQVAIERLPRVFRSYHDCESPALRWYDVPVSSGSIVSVFCEPDIRGTGWRLQADYTDGSRARSVGLSDGTVYIPRDGRVGDLTISVIREGRPCRIVRPNSEWSSCENGNSRLDVQERRRLDLAFTKYMTKKMHCSEDHRDKAGACCLALLLCLVK
jgi:hypothetical protein